MVAVWRPDHIMLGLWIEGKPSPETTRQLVYPDVPISTGDRHRRLLPVRRKVKTGIVRQIAKHPRLLATPIEPGDLRTTPNVTGAISQDALLGDGKGSSAAAAADWNLFGDRNSISRHFQTLGVEWLGHQRPLTHEEQIPPGIDCI